MNLNPITKAKYGLTDGSIPDVHLTSKKILATFAIPHPLNATVRPLMLLSFQHEIQWNGKDLNYLS